MKVEISYMFDASELGGQNLVTFEELYDLKNPEEPVKVAEHKDIDDEGQTVLITERKILIHTTATDKKFLLSFFHCQQQRYEIDSSI